MSDCGCNKKSRCNERCPYFDVCRIKTPPYQDACCMDNTDDAFGFKEADIIESDWKDNYKDPLVWSK